MCATARLKAQELNHTILELSACPALETHIKEQNLDQQLQQILYQCSLYKDN